MEEDWEVSGDSGAVFSASLRTLGFAFVGWAEMVEDTHPAFCDNAKAFLDEHANLDGAVNVQRGLMVGGEVPLGSPLGTGQETLVGLDGLHMDVGHDGLEHRVVADAGIKKLLSFAAHLLFGV